MEKIKQIKEALEWPIFTTHLNEILKDDAIENKNSTNEAFCESIKIKKNSKLANLKLNSENKYSIIKKIEETDPNNSPLHKQFIPHKVLKDITNSPLKKFNIMFWINWPLHTANCRFVGNLNLPTLNCIA